MMGVIEGLKTLKIFIPFQLISQMILLHSLLQAMYWLINSGVCKRKSTSVCLSWSAGVLFRILIALALYVILGTVFGIRDCPVELSW